MKSLRTEKNIIEKIIISDGANPEIGKIQAQVTGKKTIPPQVYYRNTETGDEYFWIAGGIAWPGKINEREFAPGFAVVVAVMRDDPEKPTFHVLAEVQQTGAGSLIRDCMEVRHKFGYSQGLLKYWYGDHLLYNSVLDRINQDIKAQTDDDGFYLTPPVDFDQPNAFEVYADSIRSCLEGDKRLFLGECDLVRGHLQNFKMKSPAIWALGGIIHTLSCYKPWMWSIEGSPSRYINFK